MTLKADVYQLRGTRRWFFSVFDTKDPGQALASGFYPAHQWREAYEEAYRQLFLHRFRPMQERLNKTIKALAAVYPVHRHGIDPALWQAATRPPEPKTWEGDYA